VWILRARVNTQWSEGMARHHREQSQQRDDHIKLEGVITNVFAGGQFEVQTDSGATVRANLCGRMRKYRIRVILGDRVTVALSPYDLTHGMIVFRSK
jgi:translation initiation factor IF-1